MRIKGLFLSLAPLLHALHVQAAEPETANAQSVSGSNETLEAIVPPRAIETKIVPPVEASEVVEVVLELVIDAHGSVTDSRAIDGPEPFRSAAESAALKFVFTPALRKGVAVSAKVRFLVRFEPSTVEDSEPTSLRH